MVCICATKKIDPLHPSVSDVLQFLHTFRRFLLGSTLKSRFAFIVLLNTILREPSLSVTMTMATFSFHMSNPIGTLVRVQLDDGLKLFWEQVEWTQQSLRLTAPDQQLHRKQVV